MTPEDLLTDDGRIDARTTCSGNKDLCPPTVSPEQCARWREQARDGKSGRELEKTASYDRRTITRHIRGDCQHGGDLALEYDERRKRWVPTGPEVTCDRCGESVDRDELRYCEDCYNTLVQRGVAVKATRGD